MEELFGSDFGQLQNAAERSDRQLVMQRDDAADRAFRSVLAQHDVASTLPHPHKTHSL